MKKILLFVFAANLLSFSACQKSPTAAPEAVADLNLGAAIMGMISIDPSLQSQLRPTDTLFIIAKKDVGPPLAVKKIPNPTFPYAYALTAENVMFPGTPFQGEVKVTARVDRDGNAGPAQPGDLEGIATKNPARVGERDVDIVINKVAQ